MNAPAEPSPAAAGRIGQSKHELDTPALCVDLDRLSTNMSTVVDQCRGAGVAWRPHVKCHKSTHIARRQLAAGAVGITCAKLGEAEVMAAAGIRNILIANFIVGARKIRRLIELHRHADPITCVDHVAQVQPLGDAARGGDRPLPVLVEVDVGMQRAGVAPGAAALDLARQVADTAGLTLAGVMGYEGHLLHIADPHEKQVRIHEALEMLVGSAEQLRADGLPCPIVSCGGTGSYLFSIRHPGVTEVQAGGAIFMDQFYRTCCHVDHLENALTAIATVVSRPTPQRVIIDAGRKTLDTQLCLPRVVHPPGLAVDYLSAEHGVLQVTGHRPGPRIGQRVELIPAYVDFTTVLHDVFHVIQGDRLVAVWPLEGRGRLR